MIARSVSRIVGSEGVGVQHDRQRGQRRQAERRADIHDVGRGESARSSSRPATSRMAQQGLARQALASGFAGVMLCGGLGAWVFAGPSRLVFGRRGAAG